MRDFQTAPAIRESVPVWLGLLGPSGSGKTFSALRVGTGIASVSGGEVHVIDTEARRSLHYADDFKFRHLDFRAPFGSLDYLGAVKHCVSKGAKVVIVDSMSHEHEGEGGYLWTQDRELSRMAAGDEAKRERVKMASWIVPSALRQQMVNSLLQLSVNLIFCFRAKERTKPIKADGKMKIVEMGWMPIAGENLMYEMTVCCLLHPRSNGVPTWQTDKPGEREMMKLPHQFAGMFANGRQLDEGVGSELATWAAGVRPDVVTGADCEDILAEAAAKGTKALKKAWQEQVPAALRPMMQDKLNEKYKPIATKMDAAMGAEGAP